ncbi:MAG: hypothetical protein RMY35_032330 [Nostoc sp. DedSLP01]|nr:hypothetical protein [Nostoc sp. DedSLP05]MDZ8103160.1 hypothetical protein [Nostoc sp. DedSLP01]
MSKKIDYIVYYDLDKEAKHGFSSEEIPEEKRVLIVREQIIPGAFGYPPMHIRHLKLRYKRRDYPIISMTDYELTDIKRMEILAGALQFLEQREA